MVANELLTLANKIRDGVRNNKFDILGQQELLFMAQVLENFDEMKIENEKWLPKIQSALEYERENDSRTPTGVKFSIDVGNSRASISYEVNDMLDNSPADLTRYISEFLAQHAFRYAIEDTIAKYVVVQQANLRILDHKL